jgi:hypothetical protein
MSLEGDPHPARPETAQRHIFRCNAFDTALELPVAAAERDHVVMPQGLFAPSTSSDPRQLADRFRLRDQSPLSAHGCAIAYREGLGIVCDPQSARIAAGAIMPDGRRFDLALPFGFPFEAALSLALER